MEKPVVVLYDNVANAYKDPFYPPTRGVALREFQDAVNNPQNAQLHNHASCLLYTSPSPRDRTRSRMPSSA